MRVGPIRQQLNPESVADYPPRITWTHTCSTAPHPLSGSTITCTRRPRGGCCRQGMYLRWIPSTCFITLTFPHECTMHVVGITESKRDLPCEEIVTLFLVLGSEWGSNPNPITVSVPSVSIPTLLEHTCLRSWTANSRVTTPKTVIIWTLVHSWEGLPPGWLVITPKVDITYREDITMWGAIIIIETHSGGQSVKLFDYFFCCRCAMMPRCW